MRARRATVCIVLAAAALSAWGCAAIIGADFDAHLTLEQVADTGPVEAGEGADVAAVPAEAGCKHAFVPDKPASAATIGDIEFTVAIDSVDYGDGEDDAGKPRYRQLGYDIDRSCRGIDVAGCKLAMGAPPEGIDGRDNAAGGMIYSLKSASPFLTDSLGSKTDSENIRNGAFTVLFRVVGYNGQADDEELRVEWYVSAGFADGKDAGADAAVPKPRWDGTDDWPLRKETVIDQGDGGFASSFVTKNAYVRNNVLVANVGQGRILGGSVPFDLVQLIVTGSIAPAKAPNGSVTYVLNGGIIAGRWKADDLLQSVPHFLVNGLPSPQLLCPGGALYETVRGKVCNAADISSNLDLGASTPCDALSVGIGFTTTPVLRPTKLFSVPTVDAGCTVPYMACDGQVIVSDAGAGDAGAPNDAGKDGGPKDGGGG